jgi:hypothetical protein
MEVDPKMSPDAFLGATGWWFAGPTDRFNFHTAFKYFLAHLDLEALNARDQSSPWAPGGSHVRRTRLMSLLQGIDMHRPVEVVPIEAGTTLIQFRRPQEPPEPPGPWFTLPGTFPWSLGLPAGQTMACGWLVKTKFDAALKSRASDAFAGWAPASATPHADYRKGGGAQWFVPTRAGAWPSLLARI